MKMKYIGTFLNSILNCYVSFKFPSVKNISDKIKAI